MITASATASAATLREAPARLLRFLEGLDDPAISAALVTAGFTDAHVDEAWGLFDALRRASRLRPPAANPVADALAACERWQATDLVRLRAYWALYHPDDAAALFHDLQPAGGMGAVLNASTFLQRWGKREDDAMSPRALAALRENVKRAKHTCEALPTDEEERRRERDAIKRRMHAWVTAWSEIARTAITRRDHLIRLGIASRRAPSEIHRRAAKADRAR